MSLPPLGQLDRLLASDAFIWATGVDDTVITAPHATTHRTLDEYELCQHYERWSADIDLIAALGCRVARYGVPWHRIQPTATSWDFGCADRPLERLLERGVEPIVDLVHHGLPTWLDGAWLDPRLPTAMAEYASRVAERFAGRIRWYTPLNEPRLAAWYCGKLGWWPPHDRGWRGFVRVLLACARGVTLSCHALTAVDREIVHAHVDAVDLGDDPEDAGPEAQAEGAFRRELAFLPLDLVAGRVDAHHPLRGWLLRQGASDADLAWFQERAVSVRVLGLNLHPSAAGRKPVRDGAEPRAHAPCTLAAGIDRVVGRHWEHHRVPVWISETAATGPVAKRWRWLDDSVAAVARIRAAGVPLVGYTWWPLFALVTSSYRQGVLPPARYLQQAGLYDCDRSFARVPTPLVDAFRALCARGADGAGRLMREDASHLVTAPR
ncbi:MAG TPA: family 1 glycosylhydrolase [Planctomycetota bacterium]|nr:family 1 glycosylhydrolase [Planctomycetota bacterium]